MKSTQNIYNKLFSKQAPQRTASTRQVKFALIDEIDSHASATKSELDEAKQSFARNQEVVERLLNELSTLIDTREMTMLLEARLEETQALMTKLEDALSALGFNAGDSGPYMRLEDLDAQLRVAISDLDSQQSGPYADFVNLM
jgi:ABC-type transporter Mla subunit MlaD